MRFVVARDRETERPRDREAERNNKQSARPVVAAGVVDPAALSSEESAGSVPKLENKKELF